MPKNKIKELRIPFPTSTKQIKLSQVMKIHAITTNEKLSDLSKMFYSVSEFLNIPIEKLVKLKVKDVAMLHDKMGKMILIAEEPEFERIIEVGGQTFGFIPDLDAIDGSEFMQIDQLSLGGISNYNKMLAVLYRPIVARVGDRYTLVDHIDEPHEETEAREKLFLKEMSYHDARSGLYFFLKYSQGLN